jgi:hypothetical protein
MQFEGTLFWLRGKAVEDGWTHTLCSLQLSSRMESRWCSIMSVSSLIAHKHNNCINILSSQTFGHYLHNQYGSGIHSSEDGRKPINETQCVLRTVDNVQKHNNCINFIFYLYLLRYTGCGKLTSFFHIALSAKKEVSLPHSVFFSYCTQCKKGS